MADEQLKREAHEFVERIWEEAVKDIETLVAIADALECSVDTLLGKPS